MNGRTNVGSAGPVPRNLMTLTPSLGTEPRATNPETPFYCPVWTDALF